MRRGTIVRRLISLIFVVFDHPRYEHRVPRVRLDSVYRHAVDLFWRYDSAFYSGLAYASPERVAHTLLHNPT